MQYIFFYDFHNKRTSKPLEIVLTGHGNSWVSMSIFFAVHKHIPTQSLLVISISNYFLKLVFCYCLLEMNGKSTVGYSGIPL